MNSTYSKYLDIEDFLPENRTLVLDYLCPLCKGIYYKPVVDPCGSIYCRKCIEQCLDKNKACPSGKAFGPQALITIDFITNVLDKLELYCKNKVSGCEWKGRLANLDEHINKECEFQCVRCSNDGCKTVLRKSNLDNHLANCDFKQEKCEYCELSLNRSALGMHMAECPKMKINCVQNCGVVVERSLMNDHIAEICLQSVLQCSYAKLGCDFIAPRSEVQLHLNESNLKHSLLFFNEITQINSKIKDLNDKFGEVTKILASTKNNSNQQNNVKSLEPDYLKDKLVKFSEKKKYSDEEQNENQEKFVKKVITRKRKRSDSNSEHSSELIQEIDLDNEEDSSQTEDSKPEVLFDSPIKNEKYSKSILSNTTHKTNNQQIEKEYYQEEITIDTLDISKGIEVKVNTATCVAMNKNEHKFVMANNLLNGSKSEWKVKILKTSGWMGIGVCLKELVISNKLKFVGTKNSFLHGTFMISTNGYIWNTNDNEEDNTLIENFQKIKQGDEISCLFNDEKAELNISVDGKFSVILNNVTYPKGNCLVPCVIFLSPGDQVSFSLMTKY